MAERSYHVIIIGGGASGMAAAVAALQEMEKKGGKSVGKVLLLESNDRVGKKILATGNGKCNFTHADISAEHYHTDDETVLKSVLDGFPTEAALNFFEELGMLYREKNGYFYPHSETASTVLDVLRSRLSELGCETLCGVRVEKVEKAGDGFFISYESHKKVYKVYSDSVILATGSKAGGFLQDKREDPLRIPKSLNLRSTPLYPALTKCICKEGYYYRQLAGVRAQTVLSLYVEKDICEGNENGRGEENIKDDRKLLGQEAGELQFTKEGISGIAVFQLSGTIAQKLAEKKRVIVEMNFLPDFPEDELAQWIKKRLSLLPGRSLEEFFLGVLHKKIFQVCLQAEGLRGNMRPSAEKRAVMMVFSVMRRAMHFTTEVTAVSDMRQAQVCRGGLILSQFDEKLECKKIPGLFACGEVLNVDGACGGYNLHFAWASGTLAGKGAGRRS